LLQITNFEAISIYSAFDKKINMTLYGEASTKTFELNWTLP